METIRFEYKPNLWLWVFIGLFSGVSTVVFFHIALSTDVLVNLNHAKPKRIDMVLAKIFNWTAVTCCALAAFCSPLFIKRSLGPKLYILLDDDAISAPKGTLTSKTETILFTEIKDVKVYEIKRTRFLEVQHNHGRLTIHGSMLGSRYDFDKLAGTLRERVRIRQKHRT